MVRGGHLSPLWVGGGYRRMAAEAYRPAVLSPGRATLPTAVDGAFSQQQARWSRATENKRVLRAAGW